VVSEATNNGATPDLADRHVEEDLHGAAERDFFLSANVKTAEGEVFDIADIAMSSGLPSDNHTLGRLDARMLPLLLILHNAIQGGRIAGQRSLATLAGNKNKSFLRIHALAGLVLANTAADDIRLEVVFALDGRASEAAKHGDLADVVKNIGDWSMEELLRGSVGRVGAGEVVVEIPKGFEEAVYFLWPGSGLESCRACLPLTELKAHLNRSPICARICAGVRLVSAARKCARNRERRGELCAAIGDGGEAVAEAVAEKIAALTVSDCTGFTSGEVEGALERTLFGIDLFLELENGEKNGLGARRATGNVDVDRNDLIAALINGVVIEDAAGGSAGTHGDDPLVLGHLIVKLANHGTHFYGEASGDNHEVGLARRGAKNFGAETGEVETRGCHGHHFDGAAGESETERPDGAFAGPVHGFIELGEDDAFVLKELAKIVGFGERNALA
jgi:hypothetical protein